MSATAHALQRGLAEPLARLGVDLESVDVQKAGRRHVVRIVVDRDGGVDLDRVAEVSRTVSDLLDAPPLADELPGPFVLEVTSPGVDRPLAEPKHWRRATGRLVRVTRSDESTIEGRIVGIEGEVATVATDTGDVALPLGEVSLALVQVEFGRVDTADAATRSDATGADASGSDHTGAKGR